MTLSKKRIYSFLLLVKLILGAAVFATNSHAAEPAGTFHQILCVNPDTGIPTGGGVPDGFEHFGLNIWNVSADCSSNSGGITFQAGHGGTVGFNTFAALHYEPVPSGNTGLLFQGGEYYRSLRTNSSNNCGGLAINLHASTNISDTYGTPRGFEDSGDYFGDGSPKTFCIGVQRGNNNINLRFARENYVSYLPVGRPANTGFHITTACRGEGGCTVDNGQFRWVMYGGKVRLEDTQDPEISGTPQGDLLTDPVLKGTKEVTVNAKDQGSGVFALQILVDGQPTLTQSVNDNNGRCRDLNPATLVVEVAFRQPCKLSTGATTQVDTTRLPEGQHTVKAQVCDAGYNCVTLATRSNVWIDNVPGVNDPPGNDNQDRNGGKQSLCVLDKSKCSNGNNAGANVTLTADWQRPSRKSKKERKHIKVVGDRATTIFGLRTVIRGKLVNKDNGQPIGNAKVRLYQTPTRPGLFPEDVGGIRTQENGNFTMIIPRAMPSRKLRFEYRPIEDEEYVAAKRELSLGVKAAISLRLSRKTIRPGQRVTFKGRLSGKPYPKAGKQIVILGRSKGERRWKTVGVARTKANGTYRLSYKFKNRSGRAVFEFKALSKFEEAYPYEAGNSSVKRLTRL